MLNNLKYDKSIYPSTSYVANMLVTTFSGIRWCTDFFEWARQEVGANCITVQEACAKFKELVSRNFPQGGMLGIDIEKVDWTALFSFVEERTRLATIASRQRNPALGALFGSTPLELKLKDPEAQPKMKRCPYCAEEIQDAAIVCRYCGRDLEKSPLDIKKAKLRKIAEEELSTSEKALLERRAFLNSEFDEMKRAENIDRTIAGIIRPLTLFRGKKYKEENREDWVDAISEADLATKMLKIQRDIAKGIIKALDENRLSETDIDEFIAKHSK